MPESDRPNRPRRAARRRHGALVLLLTVALALPVAGSATGADAPSTSAAAVLAGAPRHAEKNHQDKARQDRANHGRGAVAVKMRGDRGASATVTRNKAQNYRPRTGMRVNNPLRSEARRRIISHIVNSIESTRAGQKIRIFTWNLASTTVVRELLDANARGVSVRLIMSQGKANEQPRDGDYWRLKRGLKRRSHSHPQPKALHSWARACDRSCRGRRGISHSKYFLFSKVGKKASNVVISTSANATEVSANDQWNDAWTLVGNKKIYNGFMDNFSQSAKDKPLKRGYRTTNAETMSAYFYPWSGKDARGDRVMKELKRIKCTGVRNGTGINGRTSIRIAQDAIIDDRGIAIAKILRQKWQAGCNIRIAYALIGRQVRYILGHTSRGPVPIRQIVQDFNGDYVYERYLHAKVLSVSGRYRQDRSARIVWQGSENWSGLAKLSDEQGFKIRRSGAQKNYSAWVDYLFNNPPPRGSAREVADREAAARARGIDPYALIREELEG